MHRNYTDIIEAAAPLEPIWFDSNGVPRFKPFTPNMIPDIYANQVVLYEIACQNCGRKFLVSEETDSFHHIKISDRIMTHKLHYGDPPNVDCCTSGPTMNCVDLRVVEFWMKDTEDWVTREWKRVPELEILLPGHPEYTGEVDAFDKAITSLDIKKISQYNKK